MNAKKTWPPIYNIRYPSGKTVYQVACMVNSKRIRECFDTAKEAHARAAAIRKESQRSGDAAFTLPLEKTIEAKKALEKLAPFSRHPEATLEKAVDYYIAHSLKFVEAPTVKEGIEQLLENKKRANRRERTLIDLRQRWNRFALEFGDRHFAEILPDEVNDWIYKTAESQVNRGNYRRKIKELFTLAIRKGWATVNVVDATDIPEAEESTPVALTATQTKTLLENANKYGLLPYVALKTFCGLRTAEIMDLTWDKVQVENGCIVIEPEVSKTRSRRIVELNGTALGWLKLLGQIPKEGHIVDAVNFRKRFNALTEKAEIIPWPNNALRHNFGSYHLAFYGDENKTAMQMGNSPAMVHRHYKALVTARQAMEYWALKPGSNDLKPEATMSEAGEISMDIPDFKAVSAARKRG